MAALIEPVARLIEALSRLPGVGPKTAQRLTYHLLRAPETEARALAKALVAVRDEVVYCESCFNISTGLLCPICADQSRDDLRLCVVEEPLDVLAIDRSGFTGRYHVLGGVISPIDGIGPNELRVQELIARLKATNHEITEIILATNPSLEGEATALHLKQAMMKLKQTEPHLKQLVITRIARGLPMGSDLEYADDVTIARSLEGRRSIE